ncbi:SMP-30/gluconolactonase/LRE family protein (plasmid) [Photobacterium sp. GJ3]|uniref:SMP-30/gluconolactonase/LRE family protein n=1 Tax=Photobacterium sp. GJ3 TaxID=2829502 RepID=UPI001B8AC06C|nr:SMP-30/gluconolactonase/LRE family protein [Photobacterium sp. GJ3]QUJ70000.1 SMP-30/gluconolactonase/LRE family protein [Photobacterium sp. GJ3]
MISHQAVPIHTTLAEIGESPIWIASEQCLYWVDTERNCIHQFFPANQHENTRLVPVPATAIAPTSNGGWLVATKQGLYRCDARFCDFEFVGDPTEGQPDLRLNDAVNCPNGDLWFGSMNDTVLERPDGCVYRYDARHHQITQLDQGYAVANGIAFDSARQRAYVANMFCGQVMRLQMRDDWSEVLSKQVFIQLPDDAGLPDGLTTDSAGNLFVCHWNQGRVSVFNPEGQHIHQIQLPVRHATRCTFGGPHLDQLYITTGWFSMSDAERSEQPLSGRTFVIPSPFPGKTEPVFNDALLHQPFSVQADGL